MKNAESFRAALANRVIAGRFFCLMGSYGVPESARSQETSCASAGDTGQEDQGVSWNAHHTANTNDQSPLKLAFRRHQSETTH